MSKSETHCGGGGHTRVVDALRHCIDAGLVTIKQLALWLAAPDRRIHYWLSEDELDRKGEPTTSAVNLWLQKADDEVKLILAAAQLAGSGLGVYLLNVKGECDPLAMIESALAAAKEKQAAERDGQWSAEEIRRALAIGAKVKRFADQYVQYVQSKAPKN